MQRHTLHLRLWSSLPSNSTLQAENEAYEADLAADPPIAVPGHDWPAHLKRPYGGQPVPREALCESSIDFPDFWHEEWLVVPAANGDEAVIFHHRFECERESGAVIYKEDARRYERIPVRRLADTIDEIDGIDWGAEFEYDQTSKQVSRSLRRKE
jgi:hypothetical protein